MTTVLYITALAVLITAVRMYYYYAPDSHSYNVIDRLHRDIARLRSAIIRENKVLNLDPDIVQLVRRLDENNIVAGSKTYTIGKETIVVCTTPDLRFSTSENYDTIVFATLHEIAHVMTPEWGHGSNFWENFDVVLSIARSIGIFHGLVDFEKREYLHGTHVMGAQYLPVQERRHPTRVD